MSAWYEDIITDTVEDTNTAYTFADDVDSSVFWPTEITVRNLDATNEIFVNFRGSVATTSHRRINAGQTVTFVVPSETDDGTQAIGIICSTGETASVQIWALRPRVTP